MSAALPAFDPAASHVAATGSAPLAPDARARLREPFASMRPRELLQHFRGRSRARETYFPVPDPLESRRERIDAIVAGSFEFNGEVHELGQQPDWLRNPSRDVEWQILLHKFYYATGLGMAWSDTGEARYLARWIELTAGWIAATPPGFIAADVTGRRVQNWIYAYLFFVLRGRQAALPLDFHERLLASIDQQVEYLCANLTPKRNHRTLELYAIFLASVAFPEFARAAEWQRFAFGELLANAEADLLPDGVHCELSSDYHHLVLKNLLCVRRLAAMNDVAVPAAFDVRLARALDFSMHVHKPDGIVPSLSDGDARGHLDLLKQGHALFGREDWLYVATGGRRGTPPATQGALFPVAGYAVLRSGWGRGPRPYAQEHYLVFDCGPLGEGNHGHLDCLSFELAAGGRSLVVDPGRYTYSEAGEVNWRVRFRGTEAHNTVCVDGLNQTRYAPKRVADAGTRHVPGSMRHRIAGRAPEVQRHAFASDARFGYVCATAQSAEYDALHTRHVAFVFGEYWLVVDRLEAPTEHRYDLRFQLSERAQQRCDVRTRGTLRSVSSPGLLLACDSLDGDTLELEAGWVSYDYGSRHAAPRLRLSRQAASTWFHTLLWPGAEDQVAVEMRRLQVAGPASPAAPGCVARATALEIRRRGASPGSRDVVCFAAGAPSDRWQIEGHEVGAGVTALRFDSAGGRVETWRAAWEPA